MSGNFCMFAHRDSGACFPAGIDVCVAGFRLSPASPFERMCSFRVRLGIAQSKRQWDQRTHTLSTCPLKVRRNEVPDQTPTRKQCAKIDAVPSTMMNGYRPITHPQSTSGGGGRSEKGNAKVEGKPAIDPPSLSLVPDVQQETVSTMSSLFRLFRRARQSKYTSRPLCSAGDQFSSSPAPALVQPPNSAGRPAGSSRRREASGSKSSVIRVGSACFAPLRVSLCVLRCGV